MAIIVRVNGNTSAEGFLLAPDGARTFPVPVGLRTDDGSTVAATLQQAAGGVPLAFSATNVNITPTESFVEVHATAASALRNDTVLQVVVGGVVQASFNLTAITQPEVWFQGRFQARFATDGDFYNETRGTATGWNFALIGEPDFCPAGAAGIPDTIDKPVGRQIRFHNAVALRSHVAPVGVSVNEVRAMVGGTPQSWSTGDPVFGLPVNLGPDSYFAGNRPRNLAEPPPAEDYAAAFEPIANFELRLGSAFSGRSGAAVDRPIANGLPALTAAERTQYGVVTLAAFTSARRTQLVSDFNALSAADQAGTPGQNLKTRIAHLGGDAGLGVPPQPGTLAAGWNNKEEYSGLVNADVDFGPSDSAVLAYMAGYNAFSFYGKFFNYHSDEQCGQVHGNVAVDTFSAIPPLQSGVFEVDSRQAPGFAALTVDGLTPAAVDAVLGAGLVAERVVVTVSGDYDRLVVSRAVIANPGDPPASWTVASRSDSLVGQLLPQASVFPRELVYMILPEGHEENVLGSCEGAAFAPAPAVGFARLYLDGADWKLLLHAGTNGGTGITYRGEWVSPATVPAGCTPLDVEVLTPSINFGGVEQGLTMYREVVLLNRSAAAVTITLPPLPPPFGAPAAGSVAIGPGDTGTLLVAFVAGAPGTSGPVPVTLTSSPVAGSTLQVTLTGTSVAATTADIVLVLDRSGSMSEPAMTSPRTITKSELRNEAAQVLVDLLRDGDRIGMVRFNQNAQQHMPLTAAGPGGGGTGKADAALALASANLNPAGSTSVGDGMFEGNAMLAAPSAAVQHGLVVLTDGVENNPLYISDVSLAAGVRAYAIGFGLPQNVNVDKLSAVTGNTGGYLLVTGELDAANAFRLHKYFAQVLAGITADQIVVDPQNDIAPGETQRIPFYVTEADVQFDAVLLTRFPPLRFSLEAPDGTRIDAASAPGFNGRLVEGRACRYYRMQLPAFAGDPDRGLGRWHMVVDYPGPRRYHGAAGVRARLDADRAGFAAAAVRGQDGGKLRQPVDVDRGRSYSVLVKARSALQIEASVQQEGFGPAARRQVVAYARAFGLPLADGVQLVAQVTRPDGVTRLVPLAHAGDGRYEAVLGDARQYGNHQVVVRASGRSPAGFPLQRELTLSAPVIDPTARSDADLRAGEIARQLDEATTAQQALHDLLREWLARGSDAPGAGAPQRLPAWLPWAVALFILLLLLILAMMVART